MHHWYYNFLVRRPCLMVLAITVLSLACIIVSLTTVTLPDFSDPTLGFEARGTNIGKRLTAWNNLLEETGRYGSLVADPNDLQLYAHRRRIRPKFRNKHKKFKKFRTKLIGINNTTKSMNIFKVFESETELESVGKLQLQEDVIESYDPNITERSPLQWNGDSGIFREYEITNDSYTSREQRKYNNTFEYGYNTTHIDEDDHRKKIESKKRKWYLLKQRSFPPIDQLTNSRGYFCDSPQKEYTHFIIERHGPNATDSLFDLNGLFAMCELQNKIAATPKYDDYCQKQNETEICCRPWSIPNYAVLLSNKSSCFDLTNDDIHLLKNLLFVCFEYFYELKLSDDCDESAQCKVPPECSRHNAVYNILQYLTDYNFIKINDTTIYLKYAMIFVPVVHSSNLIPLYHEWEKVELQNEIVKVIAMDLGLENELFNECLLTDSWLVALGGVFIMSCICLYTSSMFVTVMTCIAVLFSMGLAYFIYTLVFELSFFPYMNLLAVVVIIGIGADNAFIFVKVWQCVLSERFTKSSTVTTQSIATIETEHTETLQNIMALTFRHAALSMCVTSFTTAVAFYASYMSNITAIKCFSIFAGTVVITNYVLMITWLPATVSIMERISTFTTCSKLQIQRLLIMINKTMTQFCISFEKTIIYLVMNYSTIWILLFASIGIFSSIIVLYSPGLQLPEDSNFQLFRSDHPFEVYNSKLKNQFWFETVYKNFKLPLRFVWGIEPIDDGDYTNPFSHGNLYYDNNFNISSKEAQQWLFQFCRNIRQQPFFHMTPGTLLLSNCFIENFRNHMNRICIDGMVGTDRTPCCDVSKFPYEPHIFEQCLPESISSLYATPRQFFRPSVAGPKFMAQQKTPIVNNNTNVALLVKALVVEFESNVSYTTSYREIKQLVQMIDGWFTKELQSAPNGMNHGWFISDLKFFDVQDTLSHGTIVAITVAMCASLLVVLLVTLNVLVSIYAVITVSFTIFATVAVLILLEWKLNILESVTVTTAIGLAVDFSLHYGIHYRLSPISERLAATQFALSRIHGPTVMAAITTGLAGGLMLASSVLPYIQIGLFLVIVMSISWFYATFFLMSILKVAGPQYGFMQFHYPIFRKRPTTNGTKFYDRAPNMKIATDQFLTPSSSAVVDLINSETHELESLTSNSLIKTISGTECSTHLQPMLDFEHSFNNKDEKQITSTHISDH